MNKKTRARCMNTLVCCMKQKNGKVKTENYPPPSALRARPTCLRGTK